MRLGRWLEATLDDALCQLHQLALQSLRVRRLVVRHGWFVGTLQEAVDDLDHLGAGLERGERVDETLGRVAGRDERLGVELTQRIALPVDDERARALLGEDVDDAVDQQAAATGARRRQRE